LAAADSRTVLVTGGAGYIGSHTAKALRRAGYQTVIYDDLSAGHRAATLGAPLIQGDIRDVEAVRRALRDTGASAVMHFAAWLIVSDSVGDPIGYYRNNVAGTLGTLEAMAAEKVSRFVFSSTCAVYGEPVETPLRESHPTSPINAYGQTKLAIEHALPHYERAYGVQSIRLRYFNAAGADPDGELGEDHAPEIHVIPRAFEAASGGSPLHIFGEDYPTPDGTCLRDYIHVADLASAHVLGLKRLEQGGGSATYNVGTERPSSVREVINAVERVTGRTVDRQSAPRRAGDPAILYASAEKIRTELGWVPQHAELETIVSHAWKWHSSHPRGYDDRRA
jgi:UDP-glucose-4-epimerase GalE